MSEERKNEQKNNESEEKKNFTEILTGKAEKAGEAAADAVNYFTEMLTSKEKTEAPDNKEADSKSSEKVSDNNGLINKERFHLSSNNRAVEDRCWKVRLFNILLVMYDLFAVIVSYFLALWFRFDGSFSQIPREYLDPYLIFIPFYAVFCIIVFTGLRLYKGLWRYASVLEGVRAAEATFFTAACHTVFIMIILKRMPLSYYFFGMVFQFFLVLVSADKAVNPTNIMGASKRQCELVIQSFDKMIKNHREADIPVLHVHQEDEDGSMYPLAEGTQRFDEDGKEIFTFTGQDDKGHRKAQTKFSATRFGVGEIIGQTALRPQKYWVSCDALTPIMLKNINIDIKSVTERHSLSIPALDPIMIGMINVSTKILLSALRLARVMGDVYCKIFYDIFGISIDLKYKQSLGDGYLAPLLI